MALADSLDEDTIQDADSVETVQIIARGEIHRINTFNVAKVVAFDPVEGLAEVEIAVQQYEVMAEGRVFAPSKTVLALMVGFAGADGQAIVCQPAVGDLVVIGYSRESLRELREHGDHNIKPASPAVYGWEGAIVLARLQPFSKPLAWEEGAIVLGDDPYKGGPVAATDPLMRVRVKRGERAELCREQQGEPTRYVRVTAAGKIAIGDDANELLGIVDERMSTLASGAPIVDTATGSLLGPVKLAIDNLRAQLASIKA